MRFAQRRLTTASLTGELLIFAIQSGATLSHTASPQVDVLQTYHRCYQKVLPLPIIILSVCVFKFSAIYWAVRCMKSAASSGPSTAQ